MLDLAYNIVNCSSLGLFILRRIYFFSFFLSTIIIIFILLFFLWLHRLLGNGVIRLFFTVEVDMFGLDYVYVRREFVTKNADGHP